MIKLSIIIPVYNVCSFVERCIKSCIEHNLDNSEYEIIIINDGSTDNSLSIVEKFINNNVCIISQNNSGLSRARNVGLEVAKGDYIWFVDSDDWIESKYVKRNLEKCIENNIDMLIMPAVSINSENYIWNFENYFNTYGNSIIDGISLLKADHFHFCSPFYIYKKDFLLKHNLMFKEKTFHEDIHFTPIALYYAKRILHTQEVIYYVFEREGSITRSSNQKKSFDLIDIAIDCYNFSKTTSDFSIKKTFAKISALSLNIALKNALNIEKNQRKLFTHKLKSNKHIFVFAIKSLKFKYIIEGIIFYCFTKQTLNIYKILSKF